MRRPPPAPSLVAVLACALCAGAGPAADAGGSLPPAQHRRALQVPRGRAIAELTAARCRRLLAAHGVAFEAVERGDAPGVAQPVLLSGPLGEVSIAHRGRSRRHSVLDCRLAIALLSWAPELRAAGIVRIEHFSIYRPSARVRETGEPSGHAAGLAIDAGRFVKANGEVLAVEEQWTDRRRGVAPCPPPDGAEPEGQRLLRGLVCAAVARDLFQVVVTPHANDEHRNHVHLEVRPGVDWTHVR